MTKKLPCQYTSVKIPMRLAEKILASKIFNENGYRSVSEFVMDSARRRIE
jgi:hypothetical protein